MSKITIQKDSTLLVPDVPTVPYITGDGVGAEVTPSMQIIVDAAVRKAYGGKRHIEWLEVLAGERAFNETGSWLPEETMQAFQEYLVGIKGPLTTPVGGGIRSLNVALRQTLDLYVCLRPVRWYQGVQSPVKAPEKVNMCVFRENTEDIYAGIEWEAGTERLVRAACQYALDHHLPSVTLVHKGNIMKYTEGGFKKWGYELAQREFGDALADGRLVIKDCIADAFLQNTLLIPEEYSVIATLNLNGDYVSDQLAAMVGGIGIAPGANINYKTGHAIFEATHGTAPNIAGKNVVNPCSIILSAVMMLGYFGWTEAAALIEKALENSFLEARATHDLARFMPNGTSLSTTDFTREIVERIEKQE